MSTSTGTATDYLDLLNKVDAYLTTTGHAWAKSFAGTGTGDITAYLGTATSVAETFTITATSATNFTVTGSTSGALAAATVGTPYTSARVAFTIAAGGTPFVAGDVFKLTTSPKWTREKAEGCPDQAKRTTNLFNVESLFDGVTTSRATRAATTAYVEFEMLRATEVRELVVLCGPNTLAPASIDLQWKDLPGDAWTTAQAWTGLTWATSDIARLFTLTAAPGAHKYWRFNVNSSTGATLSFGGLDLRAKPGDFYSVAEHFEIVWKAPGLDGTKAIYTGAMTYGSAGDDTWNVGFNGFRVLDLAKGVDGQTNASGVRWVSLINSPITYWLIVNGQRAILVTKLSGVYEVAYFGFGLPYEPPSVHAFPHIIGAAHGNRTLRYDSQNDVYRNPIDPGVGSMAAFYPDVQWREHANRADSGSTGSEGANAASTGKVWPAARSSTVETRLTDYRENLDGSRELLPCVLYLTALTPHVWGELDGVYWTTGFGTVAEATIRESLFDHLVVNCVFRTGVQHYAGIRLD